MKITFAAAVAGALIFLPKAGWNSEIPLEEMIDPGALLKAFEAAPPADAETLYGNWTSRYEIGGKSGQINNFDFTIEFRQTRSGIGPPSNAFRLRHQGQALAAGLLSPKDFAFQVPATNSIPKVQWTCRLVKPEALACYYAWLSDQTYSLDARFVVFARTTDSVGS